MPPPAPPPSDGETGAGDGPRPGTIHWFFEDGANYDPDAAELAWERTELFLKETVGAES